MDRVTTVVAMLLFVVLSACGADHAVLDPRPVIFCVELVGSSPIEPVRAATETWEHHIRRELFFFADEEECPAKSYALTVDLLSEEVPPGFSGWWSLDGVESRIIIASHVEGGNQHCSLLHELAHALTRSAEHSTDPESVRIDHGSGCTITDDDVAAVREALAAEAGLLGGL